jgi:hypothetical protein
VPQTTETSCGDGRDNDCDGLVDCADPNCIADGGYCVFESNCNDGLDNDNDGLKDCEDPDCSHKKCGADAGFVCCGTTCSDLTADPANCGGCGTICQSGTCSKTVSGSHTSGRCTCGADAGNATCAHGQLCTSGQCDCSDDDGKCASSQSCSQISGADFCYYSGGN